MPTDKRMKPCRQTGCAALVAGSGGYCPKHKKEHETRRGSARERGYTTRWEKARKSFLLQNPVCKECGRPANVVDHIIAHKGDQKIFWDVSNWQPLCKRCHDSKTAREDGRFS